MPKTAADPKNYTYCKKCSDDADTPVIYANKFLTEERGLFAAFFGKSDATFRCPRGHEVKFGEPMPDA